MYRVQAISMQTLVRIDRQSARVEEFSTVGSDPQAESRT